ncbi:uncharacterized protein LOC110980909 [Acanthaster planci]|uniref:Uncharacterized protein LOC110980909 n=1 Tax=Acanthaster planci TaxID=133434 RepID=A0A8B7YLY3_ACAPL|nr:uncharacterized protein LOC110980909 [Acanthaster planci]
MFSNSDFFLFLIPASDNCSSCQKILLVVALYLVYSGNCAPLLKEKRALSVDENIANDAQKKNQECRKYYMSKYFVWQPELNVCVPCSFCQGLTEVFCRACWEIATTVTPYPTTRQPVASSQGPTKSEFGILVTGTDQRQTETSTEDGRSTPTLSRENASKSEFGIFPGIVSTIVTVAAVIGLFVIAFKFFKIRRNKRRQGQIPATSLRQGEIETCLQGSQEQPGVVAQETLPADEYHPLNPDSLTSTALQETCV